MVIHHHETYSGSPRQSMASPTASNKNGDAQAYKPLITPRQFSFAHGDLQQARA